MGSKNVLKNKDQMLEYAKVENAKAVFEGMGHGQFLHEHPQEYAKKLKNFLENK
ncbi:TMEM53 family protein [Anaerococcus sp. NML200574]|nr:TMEM53 family protein [Anaerococcus sp. NML200574]